MNTVNRAALVIMRKQPYVDWANALEESKESEESVALADVNHEPSVYLVPEYEMEKDSAEILVEVHAEIFTQELYGWCLDPKQFPVDRGLEAFDEWFDYRFSSMVVDVFDGDELEHDEPEDGADTP